MKKIRKRKERKQFGQLINYLKEKGYIKTAKIKAKTGILLTFKGEQKALKLKYNFIPKKKRKDGKWIMTMYDIPEIIKKRELLLEKCSRF